MPKKSQTSSWKWDQRTIGFVAVLIFAVIGTYLLTRSYAAPKPSTSLGSGTCSVTPASPMAVGTQYTVTGSHIPSGYNGTYWTIVTGYNILYLGMNAPDANGATTSSGYATHPGSYTAQITGQNIAKGGRTTSQALATCYFTVQ